MVDLAQILGRDDVFIYPRDNISSRLRDISRQTSDQIYPELHLKYLRWCDCMHLMQERDASNNSKHSARWRIAVQLKQSVKSLFGPRCIRSNHGIPPGMGKESE